MMKNGIPGCWFKSTAPAYKALIDPLVLLPLTRGLPFPILAWTPLPCSNSKYACFDSDFTCFHAVNTLHNTGSSNRGEIDYSASNH